MKNTLRENILVLKLDKKITDKLQKLEIDNIYKICNYSRMELQENGFCNEEITKISISLQLLGFDLKRNHAKRNTLLDV
ncbi:MAG: hypothetical protein Q4D02_02705 [Clostridia bacterium]|nr:hypothetical protein [Clostridia bacterium]